MATAEDCTLAGAGEPLGARGDGLAGGDADDASLPGEGKPMTFFLDDVVHANDAAASNPR